MKPIELASNRYSAKKYDPDKKIPAEKIEELKRVLHLSPSSINLQPWKFTFVQDPEVKSKLADASLHNTEKILQADLLVVFSYADNLEAFQKVVDSELPPFLRDWYNAGKEQMSEQQLKDWFIRQVYIALGIGLSTSIALGLDSTPMEGLEPEKYMDILNMKDYKPILAMAVGYGAIDDFNRLEVAPKSRRPFEDVIETI